MSHWCTEHPTYRAIRTPRAVCGRCWQLYFYRHPESTLKPAVESLVTLGDEGRPDITKGESHAKR